MDGTTPDTIGIMAQVRSKGTAKGSKAVTLYWLTVDEAVEAMQKADRRNEKRVHRVVGDQFGANGLPKAIDRKGRPQAE